MAYIGKTPIVGNFQKCDALSASATADYTLQVSSTNVVPESVNHMIVSLNGVIQQPTTAYTVSGATLSFASALTTSDTIDFVMLLGNVLDIGTPSDDTVTLAKMASGTDGNIISYDTSGNPVAVATGTDGQVLTSSGAGAVCAFEDASGGDNSPSFFAYVSADYSLSDATHTLLPANTELWDTDSAYTNTASNYKFTVPSGEAGKYQFTIGFKATHTGDQSMQVSQNELYKNGSEIIRTENLYYSGLYYSVVSQSNTFTVTLAEADYVQAYTYIDNAHSTSMTVVGGNSPIITSFSGFKLIT